MKLRATCSITCCCFSHSCSAKALQPRFYLRIRHCLQTGIHFGANVATGKKLKECIFSVRFFIKRNIVTWLFLKFYSILKDDVVNNQYRKIRLFSGYNENLVKVLEESEHCGVFDGKENDLLNVLLKIRLNNCGILNTETFACLN
ncbi:hypothetical protein T03_2750 [Trichinella britovi]|uniref:Uncharacterized protein n=1 Tax=Trichinella britovi TaxID=45882 RepID=A0A0V1DGH6_TRIBR|nr:hypothetical protein T03_2750 [Trichinella britovi]